MRDNMKKELCIDTLKAARIRYPISGAALHSDRGSQYTSDGFRAILAANNIQQSLSGLPPAEYRRMVFDEALAA